MSEVTFKPEDVVGIEAKHITYVTDQNGGGHDLHVVKEIVHLKDKRKIPRIKLHHDYTRPYWIAPKGQRKYTEKKDYEYERNLIKKSTTQCRLARSVAKALEDYSAGPNPRLRQLSRSPYLYGSDVSSVCYLKNDYREAYPDLVSRNTVAGGDIETNVYEKDKDGEIICMSVTHKENVYLAYLKKWVHDIKDPVKETLEELEKLPELVTLKRARNLHIEVEVVNTPADIVIQCIKRLHKWKPDFFAFWNMGFDMKRMLKALEDHGIDPALVFSEPSLPRNFKHFYYKEDQAMNTTASGVTKSKGPEDQWHWVTAPAAFQCIDSMATYRVTRLAKGKEPSYALDAILRKELSMDEEELINSEDDLKAFLKKMNKALSERLGAHPYWSVSNPTDDIRTLVERKAEDDDEEEYEEDEEEDDLDEEDEDDDAPPKGGDDDDDISLVYELEDEYDIEHVFHPVEELVWGVNVHEGYRVRMYLNFGKLKFPETDHLNGLEWHVEMQKNHKVRYGLYNIIDSIRLEQLDEKINDLGTSITLFSKSSDYKNFNSNPKRLIDDMHFWYLKRPDPCVIGSSSDQMVHELDQHVVGHHDWIVTLPTYMAGPNGLKCVKDLPNYRTMIYSHVADLDIVSTYPNVSQILNIARETVVMEFSAIWDTSERFKREVGVNLTAGRVNCLEICQKIMRAPKLDQLLQAYMDKKAKQDVK